jgi:hypothetical protein
MIVTREAVAGRLSAYLQGRETLDGLVAWAEEAMQEGEFDAAAFAEVRDVVARLGVADVAAFGLTWDDARAMLAQLGYLATVEIRAAR